MSLDLWIMLISMPFIAAAVYLISHLVDKNDPSAQLIPVDSQRRQDEKLVRKTVRRFFVKYFLLILAGIIVSMAIEKYRDQIDIGTRPKVAVKN